MKLPPIATLAGLIVIATPVSLAVAQETTPVPSLEEITVTGTFIHRSEGFTPASPVQEIAKEDFEAHAPRTVADFLTQLPYSYNTTFTVGRALGSSNGSGSLNLRNLGADATLVLLNSRRVARDAVTVGNVDVNALVPQIAIERIDILKDGASSLYGSDAVGGVANFRTRHNFQGFEVQALGDMREYGSSTDYRLSGIWGAQTESSGIVVSFEYFNRAPFEWESYEIIRDRPGIDGAFRLPGWPARFSIPNRNAAGALLTGAAGATTIADPLCAQFAPSANTTGNPVTRLGVSYPSNCQQNVPIGTSANADESRYQGFIELHHEFNDSLKFFGEAGFLNTRTQIVDTPGAAASPGPGQPAVIIPGYSPSNTFRASTSAGTPLYAQNSGVQLGFDKDGNGVNDFVPARGTNGQVIVTGTDPNAVGANGLPVVPFWEDVTLVAGSRIFGLSCNLPGDPSSTYNCRNDLNSTRYAVDALRFVGGFEGKLLNSDTWTYSTNYIYAVNGEDDTTFGSSFSMPNLRAGLAGYGGPGCLTPSLDPLQSGTIRPGSGNCDFFNVFGTSVTTQPGSQLANTADMITYITAQDWARYETKAQVLDFVVSGELFNLPAGRIGLAVGGQHRRDDWSADYPALQNAGQSDLQAPFYDKESTQQSNAVFAEIGVPLMKSDTAGIARLHRRRYATRTRRTGSRSTDPSSASSTRHAGTSSGAWHLEHFVLAPSLHQRYRQNVVFTNAVNDGLTPQNDNLSRVPTQVSGNAALVAAVFGELQPGHHRWRPGTAGASTSTTGTSPSTTRSRSRTRWSSRATRPPRSIRRRSSATQRRHRALQRRERRFDRRPQHVVREQRLAGDGGPRLRRQPCAGHGRVGPVRSSLLATYQGTYRINGATSRPAAMRAPRAARSRCRGARHCATCGVIGDNSCRRWCAIRTVTRTTRRRMPARSAKPNIESYFKLGSLVRLRVRRALRAEVEPLRHRREQHHGQVAAVRAGWQPQVVEHA